MIEMSKSNEPGRVRFYPFMTSSEPTKFSGDNPLLRGRRIQNREPPLSLVGRAGDVSWRMRVVNFDR